MLPKEFIHEVLIREIGDIVSEHPYLAFVLICCGIELLGKCIDCTTNDWKDGKSSDQFKSAIIKLFPKQYHSLVNDLYQGLRCGLVHGNQPSENIGLTELKHDKSGTILKENHPYGQGNKIIFVIEYFYQDFIEACKKVLSMDFPNGDKMNKSFLCTPSQDK